MQAPRLPQNLSDKERRCFEKLFTGLPIRFGSPVSVCFLPELTNHRGKLLTSELHRGTPVHAASFIRQRRIVLESALLNDWRRLRSICAHECFHFVWPRLGNTRRREFAELVLTELNAQARGELGESATVQKSSILRAWSERRWRDYLCEAFCDTGAYLHAGVPGPEHATLAARWTLRRKAWFDWAIHWKTRCF